MDVQGYQHRARFGKEIHDTPDCLTQQGLAKSFIYLIDLIGILILLPFTLAVRLSKMGNKVAHGISRSAIA